MGSDNFWSALCVFHAHFWGKTHSFKICALKKRNDFRQLNRGNFRVEKCNTEENLSKFLNNHWVQSKRHQLWFSTKTHVKNMILILKLNLTSLSTTHILMYTFLKEEKFNLRNSQARRKGK